MNKQLIQDVIKAGNKAIMLPYENIVGVKVRVI